MDQQKKTTNQVRGAWKCFFLDIQGVLKKVPTFPDQKISAICLIYPSSGDTECLFFLHFLL